MPLEDSVPTTLEERKEALVAELKSARDIADAAEKANRDLTDDERATVWDHLKKATEHRTAIGVKESDDDLRKQINAFGDGIGLDPKTKTSGAEHFTKSGLIIPDQRKSLGQYFVESQAYKSLLDQAPNGVFQEKQRIQSAPVGFKNLIGSGSPGSVGDALVEPQHIGMQVGPEAFQRRITLRDVVTQGTTDSDSVEYTRITGYSNNARPVPEAVSDKPVGSGNPAVTDAQAGVKPQSGFGTQKVSTTVKTIATWMSATKRALADASQIRTLIDGFLRYFLEEELEDQMVRGDGNDENFQGLASVSGTQVLNPVADPAGAPPGLGMFLTLRRAKTRVRLIGKSVANAYVIHPNDLERIEEVVDGQGRFYGDGPFGQVANLTGGTTTTIWGLPAIECEGAIEGAPWCGDWRKAILWDREQAAITATDSHMDFFVRNLVAILAESRHAFGVVQPSAFVKARLL